jgi:hypothetical protein
MGRKTGEALTILTATEMEEMMTETEWMMAEAEEMIMAETEGMIMTETEEMIMTKTEETSTTGAMTATMTATTVAGMTTIVRGTESIVVILEIVIAILASTTQSINSVTGNRTTSKQQTGTADNPHCLQKLWQKLLMAGMTCAVHRAVKAKMAKPTMTPTTSGRALPKSDTTWKMTPKGRAQVTKRGMIKQKPKAFPQTGYPLEPQMPNTRPATSTKPAPSMTTVVVQTSRT